MLPKIIPPFSCILFVCLHLVSFCTSSDSPKLLHSGNINRLQTVLPILLKSFQTEHNSLTIQDFTSFQDFENITFDDVTLNILETEEHDIFEGSFQAYNVTFAVRLKMYSVDDEKYLPSQVQIPYLQLNFTLYSGYNLVSIGELGFNEENELYQRQSGTIELLVNMAIVKNLKAINHVLLQSDDAFDIKKFEQDITNYFKSASISKILNADGYLGRKIQKPYTGKVIQEITIDSLEDLEKLTLNFNLQGGIKEQEKQEL